MSAFDDLAFAAVASDAASMPSKHWCQECQEQVYVTLENLPKRCPQCNSIRVQLTESKQSSSVIASDLTGTTAVASADDDETGADPVHRNALMQALGAFNNVDFSRDDGQFKYVLEYM
jgi:hypothetical protein